MNTFLIHVGPFYRNKVNKFKHYVPPLGIGYLSSFLKSKGFFCQLIDMRLFSGYNQLKQVLNRDSPTVVGLSIMTNEVDIAKKTVRFIKKYFPKTLLIAGGPHATILPKQTIIDIGVDIAVIAEGETPLYQLLKCVKYNQPFNKVKGIAYQKNNKIIQTPPPRPIHNLDQLPFPDRNIINSHNWYRSKSYQLFFPMTYPIANLIVSRGCPGQCAMCQPTIDKLFGRPTRFRSPQNVIKEITQLINKQKTKTFIFWDDTLTANIQWLKSFCHLVKKNNLKFNWWCYSRVNNLNQAVLIMMKQSGCKMICFGIESGSQKILNYLKKGTTVKQNITALNLCHHNNLLTNANVMIGTPTETLKDVKKTDNLIQQTKPDIVWASVTTPLPGTYLGDSTLFRKISTQSTWSQFTRGPIGQAKMTSLLDDKQINYYQSHWHQTNFKPSQLENKNYRQACLDLCLCHLKNLRPDRIIHDFVFGPIIEIGRRFYWQKFHENSPRHR